MKLFDIFDKNGTKIAEAHEASSEDGCFVFLLQ